MSKRRRRIFKNVLNLSMLEVPQGYRCGLLKQRRKANVTNERAVRLPHIITLGLAVVAFVTPACAESYKTDAATHARQKTALLRTLHRGMSRAELYSAARRIGVRPSNRDYVRFAEGHGPPVDNGDFPMPNTAHPHPMVSIYLQWRGAGCALPTDQVDVYFDARDRVSRWSVRSFMSGDCP